MPTDAMALAQIALWKRDHLPQVGQMAGSSGSMAAAIIGCKSVRGSQTKSGPRHSSNHLLVFVKFAFVLFLSPLRIRQRVSGPLERDAPHVDV